ncbi:MAG: PAS domain S-box protein, partial [Acidobacteria bacterium]|nr:PAS domain S-box protein [Acidobacteriota bacterium]
ELATRLMTSTFRSPSYNSVFYLMIGSSIRHWFKHLRYATQDYADAYEIGLRSGNLQYAAYAFGHDMYCQFYQGVPLENLAQTTRRSLAFSRTHLNQWAIDLLEGGLRIADSLSAAEGSANGAEGGSEKEFLQRVEEHHNIQVTCIYKVLRTSALLVLGEHERALLISDETEPLIYTVGTQGLLPWPEHVFARLLILTALYSGADDARQAQWRTELELLIGRIRIWADNCPDNFEHKYFLAAAELARIDGRPIEAMQFYDKAIDAAQATQFLQWEGMANERAYRFWLECGNQRMAQVYWQQAYSCYDRWGAVAKVRAMETVYHEDLAGGLPAGAGSGEPAESLQRQITAVVMERQIGQLRNYASQMQQTRLRIQAATQAGELSDAMQRVRVEIAERKRIEEALRESEQSLIESQIIASLGSYILDIAAGLWTSSGALDQLFGIDQAYERTVDGWAALIHPEDRAMIADYLRNEVIGQGRAFDRDYRIIRHVDEEERWVHGLGKLEFDAHGHPLRMHGTIQDITERWRMEEKLRQLSRAVDQSPVSIVITNVAGDIEYSNPKFIEVSGFTAEEVLGRNSRTLSSGETGPEAEREMVNSIISGREWHGELHNRRKNGELYWESTSISPIRNAAGIISHFVAISEDITARKRGEAERDELIEDLQSALASVKSLSGLLPICAGCKQIRDDHGYWSEVESYIQAHSEVTFSHGMCPDCIKKWWPELGAARPPGSGETPA